MRRPRGLAALTITVLAAAAAQGRSAEADRPMSALVQRFLATPDPPAVSYRALRHFDAENDHFHTSAWMDVWTEADDARGFRYEIAAEGGSELIRSRVFRETLETERRMWASGETSRAALTPANYILEEGPPPQDGMASIVLRPRRKDVLLVDGFIVLNKDDGELVRLEGVLARTPSFWTRRVHVTRYYRRFGSIRMPVSVETVANVRIAGTSSLRMSYDYERVNDLHVGDPVLRTTARR